MKCIAPHSTALIVAILVSVTATAISLAAEEPKPAQPAVPATQAAPKESASQEKELPSSQRIEKLIRQLGDKDYFARQKAQDELAQMGFDAFEALSAAETDEDLEVATRVKRLLRQMRVEWTSESDPPDVKKTLRDFEHLDAKTREARMQVLAGLPNGQGLVALCRLVRFEKSQVLSKMAAVIFLQSQAGTSPGAVAIETIHKSLQNCKRSAAVWMLAWTRSAGDPKTVAAEWTKLIADEMKLLRGKHGGPLYPDQGELAPGQTPPGTSTETSPEIISRLIRFQVAWLKKNGMNEEAANATRRIVELSRGDLESLVELLSWLIEQKAWAAVDDLAKRFAPKFAVEPGLLYALAHAYSEQGMKDKAEETADRAFQLNPGKQEEQVYHHLRVAQQLRDKGLFAWSRREFEHVLAQCDDNLLDLVVIVRSLLAEMLHDQGQDLDAAATLQKLVEAIDAGKITAVRFPGHGPKEIRARTFYFTACHWEAKNDLVKQREFLDKGLAADPEDLDVLIACYHLPNQTSEFHAKIVKSIKTTAKKLRDDISANPDDAASCNQYAWLVGNTEGDFDEAIQCSKKSLELQPDEGGYYDTLAHAYYGKGDLENAVKTQTKAAELEPHSGMILRKLELFRKKLEEKKKAGKP